MQLQCTENRPGARSRALHILVTLNCRDAKTARALAGPSEIKWSLRKRPLPPYLLTFPSGTGLSLAGAIACFTLLL